VIRTSTINSIFLALILIAAACKKTDSNIGRDILPADDILGATYCDTATVLCYSIPDDSFRTDESYIGSVSNLLGTIADPVFGRTDASIYVNLSNPNNSADVGFGADPKLDSVVLCLAYERDIYYGSLTDQLKFNVYQLTNQIYYDSSYYNYSTVPYDASNELTYNGTGQTFHIDPFTDTYDGDDKKAPHIRIRLKNEVGQQFMDDSLKLKNTDALRAAFNGLYLTTKNTPVGSNDFGSIAYIDLTSPLSRIAIYYHNGNDLTAKPPVYLTLYSNVRFNHYDHDRSSADPLYLQQLNGTNPSLGDNHLFLQGMANSKIKISFPYLKHFSDSGRIAVNRAEISFQVDKSPAYFNSNKFFIPGRMALEGLLDDTLTAQLTLDQTFNLGGNWGFYDSDKSEFRFPIGYSAQKIANGDVSNLKYTMRIFEHHTNPGRVVLGGRNNATYPAKLKIWYTRIK
jgi:hypothetical protein